MIPSISLHPFLEELVRESNEALYGIIEACRGESVYYVAPQIDFKVRCLILKNGNIEIAPSNATMLNYYNDGGESVLSVQLKLIPKGVESYVRRG